jgi:hypothetical protein
MQTFGCCASKQNSLCRSNVWIGMKVLWPNSIIRHSCLFMDPLVHQRTWSLGSIKRHELFGFIIIHEVLRRGKGKIVGPRKDMSFLGPSRFQEGKGPSKNMTFLGGMGNTNMGSLKHLRWWKICKIWSGPSKDMSTRKLWQMFPIKQKFDTTAAFFDC